MLGISINFDEEAWPELADKQDSILWIQDDIIGLAVRDARMQSGKPSVTLRITLPDGKEVLAETSARLFCSAARAIMARYPDLYED